MNYNLNVGQTPAFRIDYQAVTDNLKDKITYARQLNDVVHSDHCPVKILIDLWINRQERKTSFLKTLLPKFGLGLRNRVERFYFTFPGIDLTAKTAKNAK